MKENKHKKTINGHFYIRLSLPITFEVDAEDVTYLNEDGSLHTVEEWEYSVDQALEQNPSINDMVTELNQTWDIEELSIEEN